MTTVSNPAPAIACAPAKPWLRDFLLLGAAWGSSFLFTRLAVVELGTFPMAGLRVSIGAITLLLILSFKRQLPALGAHWRKTFFVGLMNSAIPFVCFAWALLYISTGLTSIMNATVPLFGALIAWLWLKDRPSGSRALGLAVGFLGVVMLAWDKASFQPDASGMSSAYPILVLLLACLFYGIAASFTKVHLMKVPPLVTAAGSQCGATLALVLPMLWFWPAKNPGLVAWAAILMSGIVCTGLAYVLYFRLIERIGPARAMTVTFLIPVFAVLMGVVFLGEAFTLWMGVCGLVIVCGTALSTGLVSVPVGRKG